MNKISMFLFSLWIPHCLFASISDDLTSAITLNDIPAVITTIDTASSSSVSLTQILANAQTALNSTTAPILDNAARRYVYDFYYRPTISSTGSTVLWVAQSLFAAGQAGAGYNIIMTPDRLIFQTMQQAMDYLGYARGGQWTVVIDQDIYDANVSIPAGQAITMTGVGGVIIGNGGGDQYSSTVARTVTWNIDDSQNVAGVTPSLKMQSAPFGDGGYKNSQYMSSYLIGNNFVTNISGTPTSSPQLEMDSVYAWSGQGSALVDIGPIVMTLRNFRSGGSINFTSANIPTIDTATIIPILTCAALGNVSNTNIYDTWSTLSFTGLIKDCVLVNVKTFTAPPALSINYSSNYWFSIPPWTAVPSKTVVDQ